MRIPAQINLGTRHEMSMDHLDHTLRMHRHHGSEMCESDRYACGHPLPPFQREACWDEARQVAFIESAWLGLPSDINFDGVDKMFCFDDYSHCYHRDVTHYFVPKKPNRTGGR